MAATFNSSRTVYENHFLSSRTEFEIRNNRARGQHIPKQRCLSHGKKTFAILKCCIGWSRIWNLGVLRSKIRDLRHWHQHQHQDWRANRVVCVTFMAWRQRCSTKGRVLIHAYSSIRLEETETSARNEIRNGNHEGIAGFKSIHRTTKSEETTFESDAHLWSKRIYLVWYINST